MPTKKRKPAVRKPKADAQAVPQAERVCAVYQTTVDSASQGRLAFALRSLLRNTSPDVDVVVMCDSPLRDAKQLLAADIKGRVYREVYDMSSYLADVGIVPPKTWNRRWPFVAMYRLGVPIHPAFDQYGRVLYCDTDTLVRGEGVRDLLAADLSGCEVRGAADVGWQQGRIPQLYKSLNPEYAARLRSVLGCDNMVRAYVNSGVILWNLNEIRKDLPWYRERLAMYWDEERRGKFGFPDQDFINAMMRVRADLSTRFNMIAGSFGNEDVVRHYVGGRYDEQMRDAFAAGLLLDARK